MKNRKGRNEKVIFFTVSSSFISRRRYMYKIRTDPGIVSIPHLNLTFMHNGNRRKPPISVGGVSRNATSSSVGAISRFPTSS